MARILGVTLALKRCVEEQDAGVDEIRLAFEKAGAHGRHQAVGSEEKQARSGQRDRFAIQEIAAAGRKGVVEQAAIGKRRIAEESAAGDLLVGHDAVEAVGVAIVEILVAGCVEDAGLPLHPVLLIASFDEGQLRVDVLRIFARGNRVEIVAAEGLVEGVRDVDALDVAFARKCRHMPARTLCGTGKPTGAGRTRNPFLSTRKLG